jgi:hypothetical protein
MSLFYTKRDFMFDVTMAMLVLKNDHSEETRQLFHDAHSMIDGTDGDLTDERRKIVKQNIRATIKFMGELADASRLTQYETHEEMLARKAKDHERLGIKG